MFTIRNTLTIILGMLVLLAAVSIWGSRNPVVDEFNGLNTQEQASYCAGVFEYGALNTADAEQKYSFTKATEWFTQRAGGVDKMSMKQRELAHADLENYRKAGDSSTFEDIGSICADIVIQAKSEKK